MINLLSDKLIHYAIRNGYMEDEQADEYAYALNMLINILITDITMLIIGFLMNMVWECIVFWLAYKALRKYCGGFHFGTSLKCYLSSCIMCPAALIVIKYVPYSQLIWGAVTLTTAIILFIFSPVGAENKPLDEKEKQVFGRVAKILIVAAMICWLVSSAVLHNDVLAKIISLSAVNAAVFVVGGKIHLTVSKHE